MPEFPGGVQEFFKYINENIKYPTREKKKGIKGKVYISFTICNDGHVSDVKPYKEVARKEALIKEAMRVISMMPKWKPGTQNGKNVDVIYKVPIIFSIN